MTSTDFKTRWQEVDRLITGQDQSRNFLAAYVRGLQLTKDFPTEAAAWKIYILAALLTDTPNDADKAWKQAVKACPDWNEIDSGDCARDLALYHIRHHDFKQTRTYLSAAFECHQDDLNRWAALNMAEGRLSYAAGNPDQALEHYARARKHWRQLEDRVDEGEQLEPPNPQWQFNCDRWALKAMIKKYGTRQQGVKAIRRSLQERMPEYGSPDLYVRLKLIVKFGRIGNQVDDFIESPRGQRFLNNYPRLERLVRRLLTKH